MIGSSLTTADPEFTLSPEEFARFVDFFYKYSGMVFEEARKPFVEKRVHQRMVELGLSSFGEYISRLRWRRDAEELQALTNLLTINETYFFREPHQFDAMVAQVLPSLEKNRRQGDTIRIWSSPCSTGEEAYSIALYLLESWPSADSFDIEILGSDIDTEVLKKARDGVFSQRSIQKLPPHFVNKYFQKDPSGKQVQIIDDLRESITFFKYNVLDPETQIAPGTVDVIFCRNLLIYFDEASRRTAVDNFYTLLKDDGVLFLGHSESMSRISGLFLPVKLGEAVAYRKKL